jgi:hypothetical protein
MSCRTDLTSLIGVILIVLSFNLFKIPLYRECVTAKIAHGFYELRPKEFINKDAFRSVYAALALPGLRANCFQIVSVQR